MIEFKFDKVDWEKYEYPGFEIGDTLRELVTQQLFRCKDVATALDLHLGEEDIPGYYKFISIDNPCGFAGTIWTNPELFELAQKRKASPLDGSPHKYEYKPMNWVELDRQMRGEPEPQDPNELNEEEAEELRIAMEQNNNNFEWHIQPPQVQQVQAVNVNNIAQANGVGMREQIHFGQIGQVDDLGRRIVRAPNPFDGEVHQEEDPLDQRVQAPHVGDVRFDIAGNRLVFEADHMWHAQPFQRGNEDLEERLRENARLRNAPRPVMTAEERAAVNRRIQEQIQANREREQLLANQLRQAAEGANPQRRR